MFKRATIVGELKKILESVPDETKVYVLDLTEAIDLTSIVVRNYSETAGSFLIFEAD